MEETSKLFIKVMMYYGIALDEPVTNTVRGFAYQRNKEETDTLIKLFPEDHPSRKVYEGIDFENFETTKLEAITKMAMWVIEKNVENWDIHTEEEIEKYAEEIYQMDTNNIQSVIASQEESENGINERLTFDFAILYKYLASKEPQNIDYLKKEALLIEKTNLAKSVIIDEEELIEKYSYLAPIYADLAEKGQYEISKAFYNKYISIFEDYLKDHPDSYQAKNDLASTYAQSAYVTWDMGQALNENADELLFKSIALREELAKDYPNAKKRFYTLIAVNYQNIAYEYKKAYKQDNNEDHKDKYIELYSKAIFYREELEELDLFENADEKIDNEVQLAKINYFLFNDEKAKEYLNKAIETRDLEENVSQESIDRINKLSEVLQSKE